MMSHINATRPAPYSCCFDGTKVRIKLPSDHPQFHTGGYPWIESVCGQDVIIEENVVIHAPFRCGSNVRIGSNVTIQSDVEIGDNVVIQDGCVVPEGTKIAEGYIWTMKDSVRAFLR